MDWLLLLVLGSVLFLVRDALLLSVLRHCSISRQARAGYTVIFLASFTALGAVAELVSREQGLGLLRDSRFWVSAIVLHALSWMAFLKANQAQAPQRRVLLLTLIPLPLFLLAAGGLCWILLAQTRSLNGSMLGACLGAAWVALVLFASARMPEIGRERARRILDFAAATNLSAILLLPVYGQSGQRALADAAVQPDTSLLALIATASLIGASFLFHRLRGTR